MQGPSIFFFVARAVDAAISMAPQKQGFDGLRRCFRESFLIFV